MFSTTPSSTKSLPFSIASAMEPTPNTHLIWPARPWLSPASPHSSFTLQIAPWETAAARRCSNEAARAA